MSSYLDAVTFVLGLVLADATMTASVGERVFTDMASELVYPYVFIDNNAAAPDNQQSRALMDYRLQVVVISQNMVQASVLGERLYTILHNASPDEMASYAVWSCEMVQKIHLVFVDAEKRFYRDGGIFRIRLND